MGLGLRFEGSGFRVSSFGGLGLGFRGLRGFRVYGLGGLGVRVEFGAFLDEALGPVVPGNEDLGFGGLFGYRHRFRCVCLGFLLKGALGSRAQGLEMMVEATKPCNFN